MGLQIKRNSKKQYQLKSSISDELLHDEKWISENDTKKVLIERAYLNFIKATVEINMDFPNSYQINDKYEYSKNHISFNEWWLKRKCEYKPLIEEFERVKKELDINFNFEEDEL